MVGVTGFNLRLLRPERKLASRDLIFGTSISWHSSPFRGYYSVIMIHIGIIFC